MFLHSERGKVVRVAYVNLWELITTVAAMNETPNASNCQDILDMKDARFGTELSFEITEYGMWIITIFDHEDHTKKIVLHVSPTGAVNVLRNRSVGDITESRSVSF